MLVFYGAYYVYNTLKLAIYFKINCFKSIKLQPTQKNVKILITCFICDSSVKYLIVVGPTSRIN